MSLSTIVEIATLAPEPAGKSIVPLNNRERARRL